MFTYPGGQELVTPRCINKMLRNIFPGANLTARCFRAGVITILARQEESKEFMKDVGRWTSESYTSYIKKGRANNWSKILKTLRGLHTSDWE